MNSIYVLYDNHKDLDITEPYYWASITEIVNTRMIYNSKIHSLVTRLFLNRDYLCNIYDLNNKLLENPVVLYQEISEKEKDYSISIGADHNNTTDFRMFRDIDTSTDKQILRVMIFLGNIYLSGTQSSDYDKDKYSSRHYVKNDIVNWNIGDNNAMIQMNLI